MVRLSVWDPTEGRHVRKHTAVCERISLPQNVSKQLMFSYFSLDYMSMADNDCPENVMQLKTF